MMRIFRLLVGLVALTMAIMAGTAKAQETSYLQIEAQPTLTAAMDRARAYSADFSDVQGFRVSSGWYAIVLGPMSVEDAANRLLSLREQNLIPYDSFVATAADLGQRFWPAGDMTTAGQGTIPAPQDPAPAAAQDAPQDQALTADAAPAVEETQDQALESESLLTQDERAQLQAALKWYGFYDGALDGAIGKGSRKSMAAWQQDKGYDPTGVLTTAQRQELVGNYTSDKAEFGFDTVTDSESGIEVTLPLGLVAFDTYAPPFALYAQKAGSGLTVRLISEPGDAGALPALYEMIQSLDVMPADGPRELGEDAFTIQGTGTGVQSLAFAQAGKGNIKGYLVSWSPELNAKIDRILPVIRSSFRSLGAQALDPGLVPLDEALRQGLIAGLQAKVPEFSQSGLYVSASGLVVTAAQGLDQCGRLTIEGDVAASLVASDAASGLALLQPQAAIAPQAFGRMAQGQPLKGAQVTAVGWSYGTRLPAPVLNPGIVAETSGLDGSAGQFQLAMDSLPGDAGGPVLDGTGAVLGLVLPPRAKGPALPQGVTLAIGSQALSALLTQANLPAPTPSTAGAPTTPDALAAAGQGMTALVGCWK